MAAQLALPLTLECAIAGDDAIVVGNANRAAIEALRDPTNWPYRTAILRGPRRSGRTRLAHWFEAQGGEAVDDADAREDDALFHRWNAAQSRGIPLLLIAGPGDWAVALPDLRSRLSAALPLAIGVPDDAMLAALIEHHAAARGLALDADAPAWLAARMERSHAAAETLVATIDRLSLERKAPPGRTILRDALERTAAGGEERARNVAQPTLF